VTFALEFPPISHLVEWTDLALDDSLFAINKIVLIYLLATVLTILLFWLGGRRKALVPVGAQNVAEASLDFIDNGIILQTIGPEGLHKKWIQPFLTSVFFFVFFTNITEVIPFIQMPANARMAMPAALALLVWLLFNGVGVANQGLGGYLKSSLFPPGVPKALYLLVTPIEFVSTFLVRPFSLAVRLFANMLAGHILLVTFAVLSAALWVGQWYAAFLPLPALMLVFLTGFEILVAFLQAYIFTILAAVYIGGAMHPEH
jgi:F-type H+-transporting ATPase subunit a